jgi:hypothetical protein
MSLLLFMIGILDCLGFAHVSQSKALDESFTDISLSDISYGMPTAHCEHPYEVDDCMLELYLEEL